MPVASDRYITCGIERISELGVGTVDWAVGRGAFALVDGWVRTAPGMALERLSLAIGTDRSDAIVGVFDRTTSGDGVGDGATRFTALIAVTQEFGSYGVSADAYVSGELFGIDLNGAVEVLRPANPFAGLAARTDRWLGSIDGAFVSDSGPLLADADGAYSLDVRNPAWINAWSIDLETEQPPAAVIARLGGVFVPVIGGYARHDVVRGLSLRKAASCGYRIPIVPPFAGSSLLEIFAVFADATFSFLGRLRVRALSNLPSSTLPNSCEIVGSIDEFRVDGVPVGGEGEVRCPQESTVELRGWCIDRTGPRLISGLEVLIDGIPVLAEWWRYGRPDVIDALHDESMHESGFHVSINTRSIRAGRHAVHVLATTARSDAVAAVGRSFELVVGEANA